MSVALKSRVQKLELALELLPLTGGTTGWPVLDETQYGAHVGHVPGGGSVGGLEARLRQEGYSPAPHPPPGRCERVMHWGRGGGWREEGVV
jgi:hypothetical protein